MIVSWPIIINTRFSRCPLFSCFATINIGQTGEGR
jgi:hypothetical protein